MNNVVRSCIIAVIVAVFASSVAAGDSTLPPAPDGHNSAYAKRLPSRLMESVEEDMQQVGVAEQTQTPDVEPVAIDGGFVIVDGRYLPPPYVVQLERGAICINGQRVSQRRPGPFFHRPGNMQGPNRGPQHQGGAQIERHLREDGLLICSHNKPMVFVSAYQAIPVLEILLCDEPADAKVQKLTQTDTPWIASEQWALLIEQFESPAGLADRVQTLKQRQAELAKDDVDNENELHWIVLSGITFSGFILAVWALGTLLCCRPPMLKSSQSVVLSKRSCRQVIWLVVLIAVLNVYDLTCTVFASTVGGLWELNPFAGSIINENSGIVVFKLGLTAGAAILFLVTRRHRLAQVGSWWIGVLYTVLILRWTTFNSMFL
ncbi:MAG: hypothetical protein JXM79_22385 [Sedimentisphaerales bacterium]|nr:hypothetical protein [Sedimentisphaerales bacterium]